MTNLPAIAIFDVGKTNKKILLFDEQYNLVHKEEVQLEETADEDGFPCENIQLLTQWMEQSLQIILSDPRYQVRAVNFTGYGASLVHLDGTYKPFIPLYNYLKPYPSGLQEQFYHMYGGQSLFSMQTASPALGSLNSGMQIFRLKYERPDVFSRIVCSLHLPQYLSFIISGKLMSDLTSIGCHTNLWHFENNEYHPWVEKENITPKLAQIHPSDLPVGTTRVKMNNVPIGVGLHDSSASLIPYLNVVSDPFILISTGTWSICLNPFNHTPLTKEELENDCLFYISYKGKFVKASRLFAGHEHEQQTKRIASFFARKENYHQKVSCDMTLVNSIFHSHRQNKKHGLKESSSPDFSEMDLSVFESYEVAYHHYMYELMVRQVNSLQLIMKGGPVKKIFVDGGFSRNSIYMSMLAASFPKISVFAATVSQATAMGAALSIHSYWNEKEIPSGLIELQNYSTLVSLHE